VKLLRRIFGPRIKPEDDRDQDPDLGELAEKSDRTLHDVASVLSPERQRVADSIRATATAVRKSKGGETAREH
jgi:hypothetical protein